MKVRLALWNPIVAKEYVSRMRTWRSPLAMTIYILLLGGLGWAFFSSQVASARSSFGYTGNAAGYGQNLFTFLVIFQVVLLAFVTPALTAGAISGERERQTIDLLFCTRIRPFSILWGKLVASMSFVLLLLLLSMPVFSLVFLFGGIELDQLLLAFVVTTVAALTFGALGLFFSTLARRTLPATVAAYAAAFLLLFGSLLVAVIIPAQTNAQPNRTPALPAVTYLSPIVPLVSLTNAAGFFGFRAFPAGGVPQQALVKGGSIPQVPSSPTTIPSGLFEGWQYWQATVTLHLMISLLAMAASALLVPPIHRLPWRRITPPPVVPA